VPPRRLQPPPLMEPPRRLLISELKKVKKFLNMRNL